MDYVHFFIFYHTEEKVFQKIKKIEINSFERCKKIFLKTFVFFPNIKNITDSKKNFSLA
jgi:hypothetical protein